jgi:hypothetical protein
VSNERNDWGLRLRQNGVVSHNRARRVQPCDRTAYLSSLLALLLRAHDVPRAAASGRFVCGVLVRSYAQSSVAGVVKWIAIELDARWIAEKLSLVQWKKYDDPYQFPGSSRDRTKKRPGEALDDAGDCGVNAWMHKVSRISHENCIR